VYQPERIKEESAHLRLHEVGADALVVVAYGQILPASLLDVPRLGSLNVHPSLLPRHRGPAPIEWSILKGDRETGVTIIKMDPGVDSGPILAQLRAPIEPNDTTRSLGARLAELGGSLLVRTLEDLQAGRLTPVPQPTKGITLAPRLRSEDGKLYPDTMSSKEIDRRVRALAERPGCWITLMGVEVKVIRGHRDEWDVLRINRPNPLDYLPTDPKDGLRVPTIRGHYLIDEVQPPGGRPMTAEAWLRGLR
jgi:methionyl-tRNA formyltransferase